MRGGVVRPFLTEYKLPVGLRLGNGDECIMLVCCMLVGR